MNPYRTIATVPKKPPPIKGPFFQSEEWKAVLIFIGGISVAGLAFVASRTIGILEAIFGIAFIGEMFGIIELLVRLAVR